MERFVIERDIPSAGTFTADELRAVAAQSNKFLASMTPAAQWIQSFMTDDCIYCLYLARDEAAVLEHARRGGFPANRVLPVRRVIDPTTAGPNDREGRHGH